MKALDLPFLEEVMARKQKTILINTPHLNNSGGIANLYSNLYPILNEYVEFNFITYYLDRAPNFLQQLGLYCSFLAKLIRNQKYKVILLNPSLNYKAVRRDSIYILIALLLNRKVNVFWHGWVYSYFDTLKQKSLGLKLFQRLYTKVNKHFVLAEEFKRGLGELGIKTSNISVETTCVSDELITLGVKENAFQIKKDIHNLLFLSRIEDEKGIYEVLSAFKCLKIKYPEISLTIAGRGSELQNVKRVVLDDRIPDVRFAGYVKGTDKVHCYKNSEVLIFPSFREGLPLSVLEAMSFGLIICTTLVGGLKEVFHEGMGESIKWKNHESIVKAIDHLKSNRDRIPAISIYNREFAAVNFSAQKVAFSILRQMDDEI